MSNGASETNRTVMLKRIVDPSDPNPDNPTNYVDVPVIVSIILQDDGDGQEYDRDFDSTAQNTARTVHNVEIKSRTHGAAGDDASTSTPFMVERIDSIQVQNADQDEEVDLINKDPAPLPPPSDPSYDPTKGHLKTHVVRYNKDNKNDPGSAPWIDIELVDAVELVGFIKQRSENAGDSGDAAQELEIDLDNDVGDASFYDPNDPYNPTFSDITYWQPQGYLPQDTNGNPDPVRLDPFQNIVNVSWGGRLYLYLRVYISNGIGTSGPGADPGSASAAVLNVAITKQVQQLDVYYDPSYNLVSHGFGGCLTYIPPQQVVSGIDTSTSPWSPIWGPGGTTADQAWGLIGSGTFSYMNFLTPSINNGQACAPEPTQAEEAIIVGVTYYYTIDTIPVDYGSYNVQEPQYLYKVASGNDIITVTVGDLIPTEANYDANGVGTWQSGSAQIVASVYSTIPGSVSKLSDLVDVYNDGNPRPDPDDTLEMQIDSTNQGTFKISIHQDTTTTQTDNWGNIYNPYKITFDPDVGSTETTPAQPPQQLPPWQQSTPARLQRL